MGEVYRADDLKLGQPVALKFLPADVDRDPARLTQLHTEVRMARQVSHPNVCRVYDIDEVDGHTFLSMEYVDGEDLSSLLRRIGRFPEDRGHRDRAPDLRRTRRRARARRGPPRPQARQRDARRRRATSASPTSAWPALSGEALRAGTPAYMAPEQLAGGEVTVAQRHLRARPGALRDLHRPARARGKQPRRADPRARAVGHHAADRSSSRDLDPEIERDHALPEARAAQRPASALAVAASLPGGDPLAAALAAGETPSPEMVAAAGMDRGDRSARHVAGAAWIVCRLVRSSSCSSGSCWSTACRSPSRPRRSQDRAQEALANARLRRDVRSRAWGLGIVVRLRQVHRHAPRRRRTAGTCRATDGRRPSSYWYRTSPLTLVPWGDENPLAGTNPPLTHAA